PPDRRSPPSVDLPFRAPGQEHSFDLVALALVSTALTVCVTRPLCHRPPNRACPRPCRARGPCPVAAGPHPAAPQPDPGRRPFAPRLDLGPPPVARRLAR